MRRVGVCSLAIGFVSACGLSQKGEASPEGKDASANGGAFASGGGGGFPNGGTPSGGSPSGGSPSGGSPSGGSPSGGVAGQTGAGGAAKGGSAGSITAGAPGAGGSAGQPFLTGGTGGVTPTDCNTLFGGQSDVVVCPGPPLGMCAVAYGSNLGTNQTCDEVCAKVGSVCTQALDDESNEACSLPPDPVLLECSYEPSEAVCFCAN